MEKRVNGIHAETRKKNPRKRRNAEFLLGANILFPAKSCAPSRSKFRTLPLAELSRRAIFALLCSTQVLDFGGFLSVLVREKNIFSFHPSATPKPKRHPASADTVGAAILRPNLLCKAAQALIAAPQRKDIASTGYRQTMPFQ